MSHPRRLRSREDRIGALGRLLVGRGPLGAGIGTGSPARMGAGALLLLLLLVALAGGTLAGADRAGASSRPTLPSIERQVMCVTCKIPLDVAESQQADRERAFIQGLIDEGRSEAQIKRSLVEQYGSAVLGLPQAHGFDLTVYLAPVAVLLGLIAVIALLLPRWRRGGRSGQASGGPPAPLDAADAERLDADLARFR